MNGVLRAMMRLFVIYKAFDVVAVPFPFTDKQQAKRRPALVLSSATKFNEGATCCVMAMITTSTHESWPLDVVLKDEKDIGLSKPSIVRMKLFTLDERLIVKKIGKLGGRDKASFCKQFKALFCDIV